MAETLDILVRERGARVVKRSIDDIAVSAEGAGAATNALRSAFAGLTAILASAATFQAAEAYNRIQNAIRVSIQPTEDLGDTTERLFDIAQSTRSEIEANVRLYNRLALSATELGASQEDLFTFLETTGKALAIQGTSAESARGALLQLAQATGAGIVRAEEFNSILEGALPIAQAAAAGIERTGGSVAKLRKEIIEGTVTSKEFFDAILSQSEEVERRFGRTVITVGQSFTNLNSAFIKFIGELDQSLGVTRAFAGALNALAQNLDIVFGSMTAFVGLVAARYVGVALAAAVPATYAFVTSLNALNIALLAAVARARLAAAAMAVFGGPAGIVAVTATAMGALYLATRKSTSAIDEFNVKTSEAERLLKDQVIATREQAQVLIEEAIARREKIKGLIEEKRASIAVIDAQNALLGFSQIGVETPTARLLRSYSTELQRQTVLINDLREAQAGLISRAPGSMAELSKEQEKRADKIKELEERLNPVLAAERELVEVETMLNKAIADGTATAEQRDDILQRLRDDLNDQLEPLLAINAALGEEAQLLRLTGSEREIQTQLLRLENQLRREGVTLLPEERARLEVQLRELELSREKARVLEDIRGPMETYTQQQRVLNELLAEGAITQEQANEKLREARINFLETQKDFESGVERGFLKMAKDTEDYAAIAENAVTGAFESASSALAQFAVKGKADFGSLVESILQDLIQLSIKALALPFINQIFGGAGGFGFGGGLPGASLGGVGAGAGFTPNIPFLEKGGIAGAASNPTVAAPLAAFRNAPRFANGGMAAVVHRGEGIFTPEQMENADRLLRQRSPVNVIVNNNAPNTQATSRQQRNGQGGLDIEVSIDEINAQLIRRSGSRTSQALKQEFGASRATVGRG